MKILVVDDDTEFCDAASMMLELLGHEVMTANSLKQATAHMDEHKSNTCLIDHILLDFMLPDGSGLHLLDTLQGLSRKPRVTLVTGHPSVKQMVLNLTDDNVNYMLKPITKDGLQAALLIPKPSHPQKIRKASSSKSEVKRYFGCLVGESKVMHELYRMIERVGETSANVLLMGESGAGKEVVANAIHYAAKTAGQFVATNCGALTNDLISSELFGHEKGAFTGAVSTKAGVFEQAKEGTLFLDEVTEMPIEHQPTLLRALETNSIVRVGGVKQIPINCRVVSATNRTEAELAEKQVLREDIYFRLAVFPIKVPALRERKDDIEPLARLFLSQLNEQNGTQRLINDQQLERLVQYDWPGNVRELKHAIHRAFIMVDPASQLITLPDDFSSPFSKKSTSSTNHVMAAGYTIESVEKELILVTLKELKGDKPQAAKMLGISLKTLYNRINKYSDLSEFNDVS
ncbi:sigma-54-dependent transcriptional regulator [Marinagarivorans algicola]|uniref:sigma-54-dependent transcriptional regulator n=1 Tax=Marinagarivorans algicola TaxID=1513270 RepID=UPI000B30AB5A|nr:sigma-54 dependent transcriptional regulator [Marinagarivorans algicola]